MAWYFRLVMVRQVTDYGDAAGGLIARRSEATMSTRTIGPSRRTAGQSVVEFALILPLLLAFLGASLDFARVFQAWITLESATRDAAEIAATQATTTAAAQSLATTTVCSQTSRLAGYVPSGATCIQPAVTVVSFTRSTTASGATTRNPIATVTVSASLPFRTLFAYPVITDAGAWTVRASATYAISQGR